MRMTDEELRTELARLEIDETSWRAVLLLPLVHVAWADGVIQAPEAQRIEEAARELGVDGAALERVSQWLKARPDEATLQRSRQLIVTLAQQHRGLGSDLPPETTDRVLTLCQAVAEAAGGLFDLAFTVDANERSMIRELTRALHLEEAAWLDDLPSPPNGRWEEL
jgi:uncharacterized membrane protein YebE (DUF533 family)